MVQPIYSLALLGIISVALLALYFVLYRTRIGMIVRVGIEDSVLVDSLGINVYNIFMLVFSLAGHGFSSVKIHLSKPFKEPLPMTILLAYVSRPEGRAALNKAIEISKERNEPMLIVNASPGGQTEDASLVPAFEVEEIEEELVAKGIQAEFKQYVRGNNAVDEINDMVESRDISLLIIGLRKRTAVGKLLLGSVAQEILMTVSCPVLCVKAPGA